MTLTMLILVSLAVGSPGDPTPPVRPEALARVEAPAPSAGSLWSEVQARQLMGLDGSARQPGDLITVVLYESLDTSLGADTRTGRQSGANASIEAAAGLENLAGPVGGAGISGSSGSTFTGDGATSRGAALSGVLTCEIIEVLPSGNLRIWGWKEVRVNRETQFLVVEGVVRPRDIRMDNTVGSELLAQAHIEVTGSGVVSDKQGPGWGARLLDILWPF